MVVNLEGASILRFGKEMFYVANEEGHFKVYWCDNVHHYKVEKIK